MNKIIILAFSLLLFLSCKKNENSNSENDKPSCECLVDGQPSSEVYGFAKEVVEEIKTNTGYRSASVWEIKRNEYNECIFHVKYKYNEFEYGSVGDQFNSFTIECKDGQIFVK